MSRRRKWKQGESFRSALELVEEIDRLSRTGGVLFYRGRVIPAAFALNMTLHVVVRQLYFWRRAVRNDADD